MSKNRHWIVLSMLTISLGGAGISGQALHAAENAPGSKGAKIYCFMRSSGNEHEVSWKASYELIKRQASSLFKTSPKHAAVMITEAVVKRPDSFSNCGQYLGDLFKPHAESIKKASLTSSEISKSASNISTDEKINVEDRYSY